MVTKDIFSMTCFWLELDQRLKELTLDNFGILLRVVIKAYWKLMLGCLKEIANISTPMLKILLLQSFKKFATPLILGVGIPS